jgi:eukaryotic-like serine/threonine-protein kinase
MNSKEWKENWDVLSCVESGGQADSKIVVRKGESERTKYFLKILRRQSDIERRKRMHREVEAYRTLLHDGIPKLVESNSEHFANTDYKLYLVTELIDGINLSEKIEKDGSLSVNLAIDLTLSLLDIINYCHQEDCIHRDIKPDNIMISSGRDNAPVLVDFGLSFNKERATNLGTEEGQELGNRFLRLPELGINSSNKRDPRSDLSAVCGILFYALTAQMPVSLLDENTQMPHQRPSAIPLLSSHPINTAHLMQIFDRGFQNHIDLRWSNGYQLYDALRKFKIPAIDMVPIRTSVEMIQDLIKTAETVSMRQSLFYRKTLESGLVAIRQEYDIIISQVSGLVSNLHTGYSIDVANLTARNTLGAVRLDGRGQFIIEYIVSVIGSQIVITCSCDNTSTELLRTNVSQPNYDGVFKESLRLFLAERLSKLLA